MQEDLLYKIAITKIPLVGSVTAKNLISYCGGVRAVFESRKRELLKVPGIGEVTTQSILSQDVLVEAEKELEFIQRYHIQTFFYLDKDYPLRLKHYSDAPVILYYKGTADLNAERIIGIVGTRKPTAHGILICEELVEGLKPYGVQTISGLAFGIDVTAHKKSLDCGIPTIAALGHGLNRVYPAQHRSVAEKMTQNGGLITEFTSDTRPDREHFPMRNRIIAGLCDALIVVETPRKGGSMISAYIANDYNKDVFAVPGRLKDKNSQGCNLLIKSHKAALIESAEDIAYVMRWEASSGNKNIQKQLFVELTEEEQKLIDILKESEEIGIEKLIYTTNLTPGMVASLLLSLEFKGLVKPLPGKRYVLIA